MPHIKDYTGKRAHMIGIGGSSMSGLAGMLVKLRLCFGCVCRKHRCKKSNGEVNAVWRTSP